MVEPPGGTAKLAFVSAQFGAGQRRAVERIQELERDALGVARGERPVIEGEAGRRAREHEVW